MSTVTDMRGISANRTPRAYFEDSVEIGLALEAADPVLALGNCEIEDIIGRPPQDLETGEGYEPGFPGVRYFRRDHSMHYLRDDGRTLVYEYEGALVYALAEIHEPGA